MPSKKTEAKHDLSYINKIKQLGVALHLWKEVSFSVPKFVQADLTSNKTSLENISHPFIMDSLTLSNILISSRGTFFINKCSASFWMSDSNIVPFNKVGNLFF